MRGITKEFQETMIHRFWLLPLEHESLWNCFTKLAPKYSEAKDCLRFIETLEYEQIPPECIIKEQKKIIEALSNQVALVYAIGQFLHHELQRHKPKERVVLRRKLRRPDLVRDATKKPLAHLYLVKK